MATTKSMGMQEGQDVRIFMAFTGPCAQAADGSHVIALLSHTPYHSPAHALRLLMGHSDFSLASRTPLMGHSDFSMPLSHHAPHESL